MSSTYNILDSIFSRITGASRDKLTSIIVKRSSNVTIEGNIINPIFIDGTALENNTETPAPIIGLKYNTTSATDKTERARLNIEFFDDFIFHCNHQGVIPTIRYYAFFSHLSSIRKRSDMSDYNQLILKEKELFDRMIGLNYHIKLIISLDIPVILTKWYGKLSDTILRMTDLAENANDLSDDRNIEIVVDEINALDGQFILHDCLLIKALEADPVNKYSYTKYDADPNVIKNAISVFDQRFNLLAFKNGIVRKHLHTESLGEFIKATVDSRVESLANELESLS